MINLFPRGGSGDPLRPDGRRWHELGAATEAARGRLTSPCPGLYREKSHGCGGTGDTGNTQGRRREIAGCGATWEGLEEGRTASLDTLAHEIERDRETETERERNEEGKG